MKSNADKIIGDILVVDDAPANLKLLMLVLSDHGHHVRSAKSGMEALAQVKAKLPELVLLDIGMPDIDGYEVCRRLKADEASCQIPVIFLSGFSAISDKQKGFEVGCVDYITKPFYPDEIILRVDTHLSLSRMRIQLEKSMEELKRSQNVLIQSEKLASLGRLISEIAHEVNNPLMIISGNAQLCLMTEPVTGEVKNTLEVVVEECQRAKGIINGVLRFARPSKGAIKEVNISSSLDAVVGLLERQFQLNHNIHIKKHYGIDPSFVFIDDQQVQEVFMNLLNNAKEAMPKGGVITVTTSLEGAFLKIDFKDTGVGMTDEVMQRMFEPFFTTKQEGGGIGLGVCYAIIKAHHGELKFESSPGKGTVASVLLPLGEPANG
jgi:two-component system, NtrC family, sensor kinase